jgi:hypothetical protein
MLGYREEMRIRREVHKTVSLVCKIKLLFTFSLQYAIRRAQVNQNALKLNGTHQLLVHVDDVNILGESVHTVKTITESLVVASKETGI